MVLDDLGSSLRGTLDNLRGKSRISEEDIEDIVKEIQRSLLQADVDVSRPGIVGQHQVPCARRGAAGWYLAA